MQNTLGSSKSAMIGNNQGTPIPWLSDRPTTAVTKKRKQKMSFNFKRKFRSWLYDDSKDGIATANLTSKSEYESEINQENAIHFIVQSANGGRIVQVRSYDRIKDRSNTTLHVITPDENLADALAHILQIEVLSR